MEHSDFRALLGRYQRGECTAEEQRRIRAWYDGLGAEQQLDLNAEERAALVATVWQRIASQTTGSFPTVAVAHNRWAWPASSIRWAAAAALVLGTGVAGVYLSRNAVSMPTGKAAKSPAATSWVVYSNPTARPVAVALLDGTLVTLAPASSLKYPRRFQGPQRTVYLTGEGFFNVFHDAAHPFLVYTDQVVTTVLGTTFTVRAYAGQPSVVVRVKTGRVRVAPRSLAAGAPADAPASVVVVPNQQAVYSAGRRQLRRELVAAPVLLAPQAFVFDNRPVAEVLAALEKAYGVRIAYDAAAVRNCTLNLSLGSEPLFEKLDIICEALGATYDQADGRILFHSRPCLPE
ncbi:hypothetical protein BEN47_04495 [Hymenobacter lapidarius]|uniref:FecR protein domain-containing protein n=1 Tax=Hymenobacter lapidarius TaxID=1908237 RepID=A0A1G1SVK2_9BACT|nr:FecR family protein [Hymenobacter lapidarius]OGX82637.1 hypothetical protein BEN47_04495 [Hymenobacter lapidarius]